jgi:hypothetical protein
LRPSPDALIAMPASCCGQPDIGIYPNVPFPSNPLIICESTMLQVCGDNISADRKPHVYFDPSGSYLFVRDNVTNEVSIVYISLPPGKLEASGASIPGNPDNIAARRSIAAPGVEQILPVK